MHFKITIVILWLWSLSLYANISDEIQEGSSGWHIKKIVLGLAIKKFDFDRSNDANTTRWAMWTYGDLSSPVDIWDTLNIPLCRLPPMRINRAAFKPHDNNTLALSCVDKTLKVYDLEHCQCVQTISLDQFNGEPGQLTYIQDSNIIVTGSHKYDKYLVAYDVRGSLVSYRDVPIFFQDITDVNGHLIVGHGCDQHQNFAYETSLSGPSRDSLFTDEDSRSVRFAQGKNGSVYIKQFDDGLLRLCKDGWFETVTPAGQYDYTSPIALSAPGNMLLYNALNSEVHLLERI